MRYTRNIPGYALAIVIIVIGVEVFAKNINLFQLNPDDGKIESLIFGAGVILFGFSILIHQYILSKSTKFLFIACGLLSVLAHSIAYVVRTSGAEITATEIVSLVLFSVINTYIFYLSYKSRRIK